MVSRGEVHWLEVPDLGRRPVLVLTATELVASLRRVVVVGLTTTVRGVATEVAVDVDDGVDRPGVVNLLDLRVVPTALLVERMTTLSPVRMMEVCAALAFTTGCGGQSPQYRTAVRG
ncbi:type II toxin-antitoxin system PemK/MazF family toxin [soil metagenome]